MNVRLFVEFQAVRGITVRRIEMTKRVFILVFVAKTLTSKNSC